MIAEVRAPHPVKATAPVDPEMEPVLAGTPT